MNPVRDYMSEVIINVTTESLAGNLKGDFVRSNHDSFSAWGFIKAT